jgi:hypothetical protein
MNNFCRRIAALIYENIYENFLIASDILSTLYFHSLESAFG